MIKKIFYIFLLILFAGGIFFYITKTSHKIDTLIINAKIYTVDEKNTVAEAIAIRGNRIVDVGSSQKLKEKYNAVTIIDAKGKTIVPGFIDSHGHISGLGESVTELNLVGTTSSSQIVKMVAEKISTLNNSNWIRGRGWDQNDWQTKTKEKPFPIAAMLDSISPNNPVILSRIDGHAIWVNSKAMEICGIINELPIELKNIEGGKILVDAKGKPTGVFIDNAMNLILSHLPPYTEEEKQKSFELAFQECLKVGITSVHDMGIDEQEFELYKKLYKQNKLPIRIYAAVGGVGELWKRMLNEKPFINNTFTVRAIKLYMDGALGSRGAALIEPYSDDPANRGLTITSFDTLVAISEQAVQNGFQVCTHAIGDRGNNIVLNAYEKILQKNNNDNVRFRIEHVQILDEKDISRFKKNGIIPSMQPTHCTSDMYWAQARVGSKRIRGAYAWRSLLDDGNNIASGSDFPVENPNPLYGFYAAITRQDKDGIPKNVNDVKKYFQGVEKEKLDSADFTHGWYSKQKMTREETLRSFTIWGAFAEFAEKEKGSIEKGKLADIVMLSENIMEIPEQQILFTQILMTIVDGKIVYEQK